MDKPRPSVQHKAEKCSAKSPKNLPASTVLKPPLRDRNHLQSMTFCMNSARKVQHNA